MYFSSTCKYLLIPHEICCPSYRFKYIHKKNTSYESNSRERQRSPLMSKRRLSNIHSLPPDENVSLLSSDEEQYDVKQTIKTKSKQIVKSKSLLSARKSIVNKNNLTQHGSNENGEVRPMDHAQISQLYSQCMQLSTSNKINMANSWQLPLIDYIDDVLMDNEDDTETNFQKASCTLDASVKIYSYRVDSVHQHVYKVLGGLNRSDAKEVGEEENDDQDNADVENEGESIKKKSARVKRGGNTIESNLANINLKQLTVAFEVDPLFRKTSAAFDEAGAKGLLLNNLHVFGGCNLIFDSSDRLAVVEQGNDDLQCSTTINWTDLLAMIPKHADDVQICPPLSEMRSAIERCGIDFKELKPVEENAALPGSKFANIVVNESAINVFDAHRDEEVEKKIMEEVARAERFDDNVGEYGEADGYDGSDGETLGNQHLVQVQDLASTLALVSQGTDSAYSFFQPRGKNWMGAAHWKFQSSRPSEKPVKTKAPKSKKKVFVIDFSGEPIDDDVIFPASRASTELPASRELGEYNLPIDHGIRPEMLLQLTLKPHVRVVAGAAVEGKTNGVLGERYDEMIRKDVVVGGFEGEADSDGDRGDDGSGWNGAVDDEVLPVYGVDQVGAALGELKLVTAPRKVNKIEIGYSKFAKKVRLY